MKQKTLKSIIFMGLLMLPLFGFSQGQVTGTVTDAENGTPLPGVSVIIKGTTQGVSSDFDGNYSITVSEFPATLIFSYIGFETIERRVAGPISMDVALNIEATGLEEVVVTGLGSSVKRANLANAVSTVSSEELVGTTAQPTLDGALYGKLTGVNIVSASGAPGGGIAMRLRGISSINGNNQPLYIIDGVYVNNAEIPSGLRFASGANQGNEENSSNRIADLDPNDIENIEVLKGASAAAIYGTRANAGVVIITTKRGREGKTDIRYSQDVGFNTIIKKLGMRDWTRERVVDVFGEDEALIYDQAIAENGGLYDYEDEIYGEQGLITDTRISASGGSEKTRFFLSAGLRDEEGIIKNTGFERFSLRANLDHKISKTFSISASTNFVKSSSSRSFTGNENEGGLSYGYNLAFTRPWVNLYPNELGVYPNNPNFAGNPLFVRDRAKNEETNNRFIQGLKFTTNILNGDTNKVRLILNGGADFLANETFVYVPEDHQAQAGAQNGFIGAGRNNFDFYNFQGIAVWDTFLMDGNLSLTTQGGVAYLEQQSDLIFNQTTQLNSAQTNLSQGSAFDIDQKIQNVKEFGYFWQTEANYRDIFIGTIGYRLDKSTLNGDPNKFYGFPKASAAVNLHNFGFWDVDAVNQLKFRAAYGETGSSATFGNVFTSLNPVIIGGNGGTTIDPAKGDSAIDPETSAEFEVGLDATFGNAVTMEFTYYNRTVRDLLLQRVLETSSGFGSETTNLADLRNTGVELALKATVLNSDNLFWNTGVQFWKNVSEVTRLDVPPFPQPGAGFGLGLGTFYIQEGQPVTQLVGNIDGTPTQVGNTEPDFQMTFNNQFNFFNHWDLSFLLHWKAGGDNLNLSKFLTDLGQLTPDLDDQSGQDRVALGTTAVRFVEPADYLRMRELALYYTFNSEQLGGMLGETISGIRIGASARNLFTITDYSSYDPETSVNGSAGLSTGIEVTPFPSSKQYYFHLRVNF
ncbi:SusC/RagA family TonB-linked outer membrane protein [Robertkochia marina]|uniref:SusC/RagA family TonB-linked outer membrane protein n=1 Tax=Robertkochia marina TaxID=1227945 RepID=A0A4S3M316_9FLAO|nr:SusC/RagA family TonB-linked outer membrane protein [Robertkochia marina]THD69453.1 SusC/RagA family TonB-linked outer membrane protein [Robertkochia marina]TRZ47286.1 SusC/RagA family TonB-linked outer membrane protein [Robertkochia marina]